MFQKEMLLRAVELALQNVQTGNGGPFGAVIVKDGQIIAEGVNQVTSTNDPTAHAEIVAIRKACQVLGSFQLTDCEIYSSCEPCPMCLGAIYWARPKALYFASSKHDAARAGFDDSFIYDEIMQTYENRKITTHYIPLPEAQQVFDAWIHSDNKQPY